MAILYSRANTLSIFVRALPAPHRARDNTGVNSLIDLRELGRRVKALREAKGWTQDQLAECSGVPQGTISRIERGRLKRQPSLENIVRLAKALGVRTSMLLAEEPLLLDEDAQRVLLAMEHMPLYRRHDLVRISESLVDPAK